MDIITRLESGAFRCRTYSNGVQKWLDGVDFPIECRHAIGCLCENDDPSGVCCRLANSNHREVA